MQRDADVIVVGSGLAGLVAASEIAAAGKRVIILEQENEPNLGGQAFWSFGGLFFVDSPEQRRLRIRDSHELAWLRLDGGRGVRPRGGSLAEALGGGLCGLRRGRETRLAALARPSRLSDRRLGRARRRRARSATAIRCRASTSPGVRGPASWSSSRASCAKAVADGLATLRFRHRVDALRTTGRRGRRRARHLARAVRARLAARRARAWRSARSSSAPRP